MAKDVTKIATFLSFQVRPDGLYRLINYGQWSRIACRSRTLELRFQHGQILIDEAPPSSAKASRSRAVRRDRHRNSSKSLGTAIKRNSIEAVTEAVGQVLKKLAELDGIIEIRHR